MLIAKHGHFIIIVDITFCAGVQDIYKVYLVFKLICHSCYVIYTHISIQITLIILKVKAETNVGIQIGLFFFLFFHFLLKLNFLMNEIDVLILIQSLCPMQLTIRKISLLQFRRRFFSGCCCVCVL